MKSYISESRAAYEDMYHGQFSYKLAEWAISNMKVRDNSNKLVRMPSTSLQEVLDKLKSLGITVDDKYKYTAWYLYNMSRADYQRSLVSDAQRAWFVYETLFDPDCCPEAVLETFTAKMCISGTPIFWEDYL